MLVGIVGNGIVGSATAAALRAKGQEVRIYDLDPSKTEHSSKEILSCEMILLCLPTPAMASGACELRAIDDFFSAYSPEISAGQYVGIRSTIPPNTIDDYSERYPLCIFHWPEFLTMRTAAHDALHPTRIVLGGREGLSFLRLYFESLWPYVPTYCMTPVESALVKLFQNSFSAIKLAAFNEFWYLTEASGADWGDVLSALLAGGWINHMHTQVPGPDGRLGFGGACLPKDLSNLIAVAKENHCPSFVAEAARKLNSILRKEKP